MKGARQKDMRLLLAIDDSDFSEAAVQAVIAHRDAKGTEVQVLTVVDLSIPIPTLYAASFRLDSLKSGQGLVQRAGEALSKAGFKVQTEVEEGDPKSKILDAAARWKPDLIVMGSHGRKGSDHFLMGSVSEAVARHASCSVEIVRPPITSG
jgi:nucleotide-binding universal stress UspA family protein